MKALLVRLGKIIGWAVVVVLLLFGWVIVKLNLAHRNARRELNKIRVGMSVEEMVGAFPRGYMSGKVTRLARKEACRDESGRVLARETGDASESTPDEERKVTKQCEPETISARLLPDESAGLVNLELTRPNHTPEYEVLSKADFARLLQTEFKEREFWVGLGYETGTPQHISMGFYVGADGKVKELVQPYGWD